MAKDKKREKENGKIKVTEETVTYYEMAQLEAERESLVKSKRGIQDRIDQIDELIAAPEGTIPEPPPPNPSKK